MTMNVSSKFGTHKFNSLDMNYVMSCKVLTLTEFIDLVQMQC